MPAWSCTSTRPATCWPSQSERWPRAPPRAQRCRPHGAGGQRRPLDRQGWWRELLFLLLSSLPLLPAGPLAPCCPCRLAGPRGEGHQVPLTVLRGPEGPRGCPRQCFHWPGLLALLHTLPAHLAVHRLTPRTGAGRGVRHPDGDVREGSGAGSSPLGQARRHSHRGGGPERLALHPPSAPRPDFLPVSVHAFCFFMPTPARGPAGARRDSGMEVPGPQDWAWLAL